MPLQPDTLAPPADPAARPTIPILLVGVVVAMLVASALAHGPLGLPARAPRLVLENPTEYDVMVTARRPGEADHLLLASVGRGARLEVDEVVDLGDTWIFHFAGQGVDGIDVAVSRSGLSDGGWTFVVPDEVADDLAAKGAPPTPLRPGAVTR